MQHIYQGIQGDYYVINGIKYDSHFPQEWATNHRDFAQGDDPCDLDYVTETGPESCGNCESYGSLRGVFVGYCMNCAREYNFTRGKGFVDDYTDEELWENLPYMRGVSMKRIGDADIQIQEPEIYNYREPGRKAETKQSKEKLLKKGGERKIRRALRKRRYNGEYVGIPKEYVGIPIKENRAIELCILLVLFVSFALLAGLSFYLV